MPIHGDADIASIASVIGHPARGRMLSAMLGGRALPATELAAVAGVSASTASAHLARLTASGLVAVERHGRHRYHRLAGTQVAEVLEGLALLAPAEEVRSLRDANRGAAERAARSC
jgi:DNA-binding transcriptional ArsR family regulator